jgi:sec-independent protein translocase protein TatC
MTTRALPTTTTEEIEPEVDETRMTLIEHLEELRQRLIKAIMALAVTTLFSLVFTKQLLLALIVPLGGALPQAVRPTETFVTYMKVALMAGIALAMPIIIYQFMRFVVPGLTRHERRYLYVIVPGATLFFVLGMAFCYFFMLPFAVRYLYNFLGDVIRQDWTIDYYISFVTTFLLATGLVFETPLVVFFLAKLRVVSTAALKRNRKYAIVIAFVVAAVITPTPDPFNQTLVAAPLVILYEVGILLSRFA